MCEHFVPGKMLHLTKINVTRVSYISMARHAQRRSIFILFVSALCAYECPAGGDVNTTRDPHLDVNDLCFVDPDSLIDMGAELLMHLSPLQVEVLSYRICLRPCSRTNEHLFAMVVQSCLGISFHCAEGVFSFGHMSLYSSVSTTNPKTIAAAAGTKNCGRQRLTVKGKRAVRCLQSCDA